MSLGQFTVFVQRIDFKVLLSVKFFKI